MSQQFFELSGDDEQANRAEAAEHDTEALIEAIFDAADEYGAAQEGSVVAATEQLSKAIDRFATHCYGEGRADADKDTREILIRRAEQLPLAERAPYMDMLIRFNNPRLEAFETAARAMNETGQGEHGWAK